MSGRGAMLGRVADLAALARWLFPAGKLEGDGRRLRIGNAQGERGGSCVVWLDSGEVYEHNGGERIGDLVDVICERYGLDYAGAARWLDAEGWLDPRAAHQRPPAPAERRRALRQLAAAPANTALPDRALLRVWARLARIDSIGPPALYPYRRGDGSILLGIVRWSTPNGKEPRRFSWGGRGWRLGGTDGAADIPLYRLPDLLARPDAPALVVEGEKAALAAVGIPALAGYAPVCPLGGSSPAAGTDWSSLAGRRVYVLGDADRAGASFSYKVAQLARDARAAEVLRLDPARVYALLGGRGDLPDGWDVADSLNGAGQCLT